MVFLDVIIKNAIRFYSWIHHTLSLNARQLSALVKNSISNPITKNAQWLVLARVKYGF